MMGGMETNISDSLKTGINMEGYQKMSSILDAVKVPMVELDDAANLCVTVASGKGFGIVNGTCISADNGWSSIVG